MRISSPVCPDAVSAKSAAPPYHVPYKQPSVEGKCDICGGTLVQRKDDHPDTVKERLEVYHTQTEPLKEFTASRESCLSFRPGKVEDTIRLVLEALEDLT